MYKDKGLKMPFEKITQLREERKRVKDLENRMKEEERLRREDLKRRKEINKQRQEENAKKGEIVQVVSFPPLQLDSLPVFLHMIDPKKLQFLSFFLKIVHTQLKVNFLAVFSPIVASQKISAFYLKTFSHPSHLY